MPTGLIDPKAETYIPGWVNTLQRELVFPDDLLLKGTIGMVLSLLLLPRCCHMQKCCAKIFII